MTFTILIPSIIIAAIAFVHAHDDNGYYSNSRLQRGDRVLQSMGQEHVMTNCYAKNKATLILSYVIEEGDKTHTGVRNETDYTLHSIDTANNDSDDSGIISQGYIGKNKSIGVCIDLVFDKCLILSKNKASATSISPRATTTR